LTRPSGRQTVAGEIPGIGHPLKTSTGYFTTNDGVTLQYLEAGPGRPLILLAAWTRPAEGFSSSSQRLECQDGAPKRGKMSWSSHLLFTSRNGAETCHRSSETESSTPLTFKTPRYRTPKCRQPVIRRLRQCLWPGLATVPTTAAVPPATRHSGRPTDDPGALALSSDEATERLKFRVGDHARDTGTQGGTEIMPPARR
jgi:hypothetical protein